MPVVRIYCGNQRTQLNQHSDDDSYRPLSSHLKASTKPLLCHTSPFCCPHRRLVALGGSLVCSAARRMGRLHWRRFPGKVCTQRMHFVCFRGGEFTVSSWCCQCYDVIKLEKSRKSLKCNETFKFSNAVVRSFALSFAPMPPMVNMFMCRSLRWGPLAAEPPNVITLNNLFLSTWAKMCFLAKFEKEIVRNGSASEKFSIACIPCWRNIWTVPIVLSRCLHDFCARGRLSP